MKKRNFLQIGLYISLLINFLMLGVVFEKVVPTKEIKEKIISFVKKEEDCTKVYSQFEKKTVCLTYEELKSMMLSKCAKSFTEGMQDWPSEMFKVFKDIEDINDLRELRMKMCMEEFGYEYP